MSQRLGLVLTDTLLVHCKAINSHAVSDVGPPQINLKRRRASVAVLLWSPPVPIDVGGTGADALEARENQRGDGRRLPLRMVRPASTRGRRLLLYHVRHCVAQTSFVSVTIFAIGPNPLHFCRRSAIPAAIAAVGPRRLHGPSPRAASVIARLLAGLRVSGCASPSNRFLAASSSRSSGSASANLPCRARMHGRVLTVVRVAGCSLPSTHFLTARSGHMSASASSSLRALVLLH